MNAIGQNATDLAVSNGVSEWSEQDFKDCALRNSKRTAKGTTRERSELHYNKLISACCADYRSHFTALYGKSERLPSDIHQQIDKAVTELIQSQLNRVNVANVISFRRGFYHNQRNMEITDRLTSIGENKLPLEEQLLGVNIYITSANKKLDDLMKKPTPDYDREREMKQTIMRLEVTKQFIMREIENQKKVTPQQSS